MLFFWLIIVIETVTRTSAEREERMVILGGYNVALDKIQAVDVYEFSTETWSRAADMPKSSMCLGACATETHIYAVGGLEHLANDSASLTATRVYDLASNEWSLATPMSTPRYGVAVAFFGGRVYAIGGSSGHQSLESAEAYNPETGRWTPTKNMTSRRYMPAAVVLEDRLFVIGGFDAEKEFTTATVEVYDATTDTWSSAPSMNTGRYGLGVAVVDDKIYAIGGGGHPMDYLRSVEVYDPKSKTWSYIESMKEARWAFGAVSLDELIYVVGGDNNNIGNVGLIEVFDTKKSVWGQLKSRMPVWRQTHGVVLVNSSIATVSTSSYALTTTPSGCDRCVTSGFLAALFWVILTSL